MKRLDGILTKEQERAGLYLEEGEDHIFLKGWRRRGGLTMFKKGTPPETIRAEAQKCLSKIKIEPGKVSTGSRARQLIVWILLIFIVIPVLLTVICKFI